MPNWTSNTLQVDGPGAADFFAAVAKDPDDNFIATFIPMPEELQSITTGACTIEGEGVTEWRDGPEGRPVKITDIERQHILDLYGTISWYDWAIQNWGTKWSAAEVTVDAAAGSITFDTAWAPPLVAIDTISTMFPRVTFTLAYAEGGAGFYGTMVFENGTLVESEEFSDFWNDEDEDDVQPSLNCAAHLEEWGLHSGG